MLLVCSFSHNPVFTEKYILNSPRHGILKFSTIIKAYKLTKERHYSHHRQKSRTFCSRIHCSAEYVILQWDKNKMAAKTSKTDQGRDKFHTKYGMI